MIFQLTFSTLQDKLHEKLHCATEPLGADVHQPQLVSV